MTMISETTSLFDPIALGDLALPNRIVMASMTRGRADNAGLVPSALNAEYYAQRASAGMILTEGTWPSPDAIGYINVPGIYTDAQEQGWRLVTDAVHAAGGRIFVQLGHTGTAAHPSLRGGVVPAGPSAVNPLQNVFAAGGFTATVTPRAMTIADIQGVVDDYRSAAVRAKRAGFDGIELHGSSTYLIPQFLNERLNIRDDDYGGSPEKRARFLFESLEALISVWGRDRVGIKLAPGVTNVGGFVATDATIPTYEHVVDRLNDYPLAYLQLAKYAGDLAGSPVEWLNDNLFVHFRPRFRGTLIANGGFTFEHGNAIIADGLADLVSFALPFIANPDLVERFANGIPLATAARDTFYAGGPHGYIDYPRAIDAARSPSVR
jgi:N-ethylmaleimide reductase